MTRDKSATPRTRPRFQFVRSRRTGSRCKLRPRAVYSPYRGFRRRLQRACQSTRVFHHGTCGSLPNRDSHLCLQAFNAARLLQLVVPTSTRFAAPLLAQLDLSRERSFLPLGPPSASRRTLRIITIALNRIPKDCLQVFGDARDRSPVKAPDSQFGARAIPVPTAPRAPEPSHCNEAQSRGSRSFRSRRSYRSALAGAASEIHRTDTPGGPRSSSCPHTPGSRRFG